MQNDWAGKIIEAIGVDVCPKATRDVSKILEEFAAYSVMVALRVMDTVGDDPWAHRIVETVGVDVCPKATHDVTKILKQFATYSVTAELYLLSSTA